MRRTIHPSLYQVNTRVWLTALSRMLCRAARLDDVPDAELDRLAEMGFDWVWFLSVWQTGAAGRRISREHRAWQREFRDPAWRGSHSAESLHVVLVGLKPLLPEPIIRHLRADRPPMRPSA